MAPISVKLFLLTQMALASRAIKFEPSILNNNEPDFIECYWCNSRDVYCGKRVTDTMVTTIKCPRHSKCTVYTNPYDNYYLHRGCTYGMDLGPIEVKNGCFVEEDASTYCFCDFNRCNAAGILDLRNLAGTDNQTSSEALERNPGVEKANTNFKNSKPPAANKANIYPPMSSIPTSPTSSSKKQPVQTDTTTAPSTINSELNNLDQLLLEYLNFSKSINPQAMLSKPFRPPNKTFNRKLSDNLRDGVLIQKAASTNPKPVSVPTAAALQSNMNKTTRMISATSAPKKLANKKHPGSQAFETSSSNQAINFRTKIFNQQNSRISSLIVNATTQKPTTTTNLLGSERKPNLPGQYKLKINDTLAKNLLDSYVFRSKFGLKPDEKVNILVLKRPIENDQSSDLPENRFHLNMNPNQNIQNFLSNRFKNNQNDVINSNNKFNRVSNTNLDNISKLSNNQNRLFNYNNFINKPQHFINLPINDLHTMPQTSTPTTTMSWISKLKAKLMSSKLERDQILKSFETQYDWSHVLTNQYRQGLNINFKCPRDGLFSHPTHCHQFLQCVYFGTIHQRFYVLNCPSGLYFNQKLELCDYPSNVYCPPV